MVSLSDLSMDPDMDEDTSILRDGKKWKRRRTASTDKIAKATSPPNKKKRSNDGKASPPAPPKDQAPPPIPPKGSSQGPLSPIIEAELNKAPPLDQRFKRPPPDKKKRRPSKSHLKQLASPTKDDLDDKPVPGTPELLPMEEGKLKEEGEEEEEPAPSAPPFSPRIYPILPQNSSDILGSPQVDGVFTPTSATPTCPASRSDFNMQRHHTFFLKTVIKLETINCGVCNKKIKFSKNCYKCRDCRTVCHPECKDQVPLPCIPSVPTPKKKQTSDLASHCPHSIPRVPGLVVHCVNEIERRGLDTLGLYRIPGSNKTIKEVKERILRGKGNPGMDKVSDVNVICGVLTSFLKSLREPILTFRMHPIFVKASECEMDEDCLASTLEAIAQLPPANKDTLAFLILHLQRVARHCDTNKMPLSSLAKIFGPTIVGHASANPKDTVILEDTKKQPLVMMKLLGIASEYWKQYMSEEDNPEPSATSPTPSGIGSPGFKSPATPELRPVPESPFLGSCQSPRTKSFRNTLMQRPGGAARHSSMMTRGKRTGNFFAPLD